MNLNQDKDNPNASQGEAQVDPRDYGQVLDGCIEDMAGSLEKRANNLRLMRGMLPRQISKAQFDAMWAFLSALRH